MKAFEGKNITKWCLGCLILILFSKWMKDYSTMLGSYHASVHTAMTTSGDRAHYIGDISTGNSSSSSRSSASASRNDTDYDAKNDKKEYISSSYYDNDYVGNISSGNSSVSASRNDTDYDDKKGDTKEYISSSSSSSSSSYYNDNDNEELRVEEQNRDSAIARMSNFQSMRGVRYLYENYGLILAARTIPKGVEVYDMNKTNSLDCSLLNLTIWVRLAGPEIVTGLATYNYSTSGQCRWTFHYQPVPPGEYHLAVKVLAINDGANVRDAQCQFQMNSTITGGTVIQHYRPAGMFGGGQSGCCEICTRTPNCRHFVYQKDDPIKCVLYSSAANIARNDNGSSQTNNIIGVNRNDTPTIFLGCGYAAALENNFCFMNGTDDMPYTHTTNNTTDTKTSFVVQVIATEDNNINNISSRRVLPICPRSLEGVGDGRWVQSKNIDGAPLSCPPLELVGTKPFPLYTHNKNTNTNTTTLPEECWIHDRLAGNRCENGCSRNPTHNLWKSPIANRNFDYTWTPYGCSLPLYNNNMIQACLIDRNYALPKIQGDSVMNFFGQYFNQRMNEIPKSIFGKNKVAISNLRLLHQLWHQSDAEWDTLLKNWNDKKNSKHYNVAKVGVFILGPFLSSERELHVTSGRMDRFAEIARPYMKLHDITVVDWRNISMAVSHETATQYDGLHVVGSSMKVLFHMVMHALCG